MEFDVALSTVVGEFGRSQKKILTLVNSLCFSVFAQNLVLVFAAANPQWTCPRSRNPSRLCDSSLEGCCKPDGSLCSLAVFASNFTSVATDWRLVCGSSYKSELVQSLYMTGMMVGAPIFGTWADKYGRKRVWVGSFIASSIVALLSAFSPTYSVFLALRCLAGFVVGGCGLVAFVYSTESAGPSYRGFVGTVQPMFFSGSIVVLGWLAYMIRDWRVLIIVTVLPSAIGPFCFRLLPESPRWLASQGRTKEAEEILQQMAVENGCQSKRPITLKRSVTGSQTSGQAPTKNYGFPDLLRSKVLCSITFIMFVNWFVNSMVYYGLTLNVRNLGGNIYGNFVFAGVVEIPSCFLAMWMISHLGRRKSVFFFMMGATVACYICMKIQDSNYDALLLTTSAMAGKFCISASFALVYVYAAELFPTVIRNVGMGVLTFSARMGGVLCPFVVLLGQQNKSLPMFVFAISTAVAGIMGLKLPETKGRPMPETIEDVDKLSKGTSLDI